MRSTIHLATITGDSWRNCCASLMGTNQLTTKVVKLCTNNQGFHVVLSKLNCNFVQLARATMIGEVRVCGLQLNGLYIILALLGFPYVSSATFMDINALM